jgi:hypothetical protein
MSKAISIWDLPRSQDSYATWVTAQRRACSRREKLAVAIGVADSSFWPTPTASDAGYFPDVMIASSGLKIVKPACISEGSGGQFSLNNASRSWTLMFLAVRGLGFAMVPAPSRRSLPEVRLNFQHGTGSSLAGLISNPQFYELVMGWPIGWSDPGVPVTEFARWLQRSRGQLSRVLTSRIWDTRS